MENKEDSINNLSIEQLEELIKQAKKNILLLNLEISEKNKYINELLNELEDK